ncbi:4a-hydroxytetrahydrobiopterin dehydratase [Candidatus Woesearchaeota archaeon]|nr:4a-hydroxytetrahydrobiopterin dehydratase [Candidatus Woesearchaeota archaeon]
MEHLSIKEIHDRLSELEGWEMHGSEIVKDFEFEDSKKAIEFANKVAEEADRQQHHPSINIRYNKVMIMLTTHDANGLTHMDFKLARVIEQLI